MRNRFAFMIAAVALTPFAATGAGNKPLRYEHISVPVYKPVQGFSHVVGERHFVGYFVTAKDRCAVTVIDARADDDRLLETPRRQTFELPAAARAEIEAGHGKALGIGCSADADEISVAALQPAAPTTASR